MRDEFLDPSPVTEHEELDEVGLRPKSLSDFIGQRELKEHLDIVLEAARRRGQAPDHILLAGPPGLGKTSMAGIVASEMGVHLHVTSGPALERAGDLAAILTKLEEGDVLIVNDPFIAGAHLPDVLMVAPVYADGMLIAFVAARAHHSDVGGMEPGSMPGRSSEIYQEGLVIPPVLLYRRGKLQQIGRAHV